MTTELTVEGAVQRARACAPSLTRLPVRIRLRHLRTLREVILSRREEIIDAIRADTGKSSSDILMSELFGACDALLWCEQNAEKALADEKVPVPMTMMGKKTWIAYEPLGVVLVISPWNYPFFQAIVPIALNIAAGNTVVYKPSEHTPLTGLLESLFEQANFAPHWVQVIQGDGAVGADLIAQGPDKIMFTGSTATGKKILAAAAEHLIPVELELGGKDPMIVFEDANLDEAVAGARWGGLTASGQSCTSVERLYVHESIHDAFVARLAAAVEELVQGDDPGADIGGMITDQQVKTIADQVADAKQRGATFHTGGEWDGVGRMIPPMVITGLPDDSMMAREETFGPVLPVWPFSTEQEAIERANDTPYGLSASVWSADGDRAERVARALQVGGVSINNVMATESTPWLPFGGVKNSGFGRFKGVAGLRSFCNAKSVVTDKAGSGQEANWFPYTARRRELFLDMMGAWFSSSKTRLAQFALKGTKLEKYAQQAKR